MLELKPTLATALLGAGGELLHVFPAMPFDPAKATQGYVPCLILPAPRPIAEAPKEKDRLLFLWNGMNWHIGKWNQDCYAKKPRPYWSYGSHGPTYCRERPPSLFVPMLPAPSPEEATDGR